MTTEAQRLLDEARQRQSERQPYTPPDYRAVNKAFTRQKAALTRALNSGDRDKVVLAVKKAKEEWSETPFNGAWPDDWSRWQRALNDVLPWNEHVDLDDL